MRKDLFLMRFGVFIEQAIGFIGEWLEDVDFDILISNDLVHLIEDTATVHTKEDTNIEEESFDIELLCDYGYSLRFRCEYKPFANKHRLEYMSLVYKKKVLRIEY